MAKIIIIIFGAERVAGSELNLEPDRDLVWPCSALQDVGQPMSEKWRPEPEWDGSGRRRVRLRDGRRRAPHKAMRASESCAREWQRLKPRPAASGARGSAQAEAATLEAAARKLNLCLCCRSNARPALTRRFVRGRTSTPVRSHQQDTSLMFGPMSFIICPNQLKRPPPQQQQHQQHQDPLLDFNKLLPIATSRNNIYRQAPTRASTIAANHLLRGAGK